MGRRNYAKRAAFVLTLATLLAICTICLPRPAMADDDSHFLQPVEHETVVPDGWIGIYTAADLVKLQETPNGNFILMNDIDASSLGEWRPAGASWSYNTFDGSLDGNGYTISNLTTQVISDDYGASGLFYTLRGNVFDLGIINCSPAYSGEGPLTFGAIAYSTSANADGPTIKNCWVDSDITITQYDSFADEGDVDPKDVTLAVGMFTGEGSGLDIDYCRSLGSISISSTIYADDIPDSLYTDRHPEPEVFVDVSGFSGAGCSEIAHSVSSCDITVNATSSNTLTVDYVVDDADATINAFGIVGSDVIQCQNDGDINVKTSLSTMASTGGIGGEFYIAGIRGTCEDSLNSGNVDADIEVNDTNRVGQIISEVGGIHPTKAVRCLNVGNVSHSVTDGAIPNATVGGILAYAWSPEIQSCYNWDGANIDGPLTYGEWDSETDSYLLISSVDKTVPELTSAALVDPSSFAGWDFETVWEIPSGASYPTLRCLAASYEPSKPTNAADADSPLTQLASCLLTEFNIGSGFKGQTVNDFLSSPAFVDRAIWANESPTYRDLFAEILGDYVIADVALYGYDGAPFIALKHPDSNDVILAFKTDGPESIDDDGVRRYFDDGADVYRRVEELYPTANFYLTGAGLGGQAASYLSSSLAVDASTFNSGAVTGQQIALLVQSPSLSMSETSFTGVDDMRCRNYVASSLVDSCGYDQGIVAYNTIEVPDGQTELSALLDATSGGFELKSYSSYAPDEMKTFYVPDAETISTNIGEYFLSYFLNGCEAEVPPFDTLGDGFTSVTLGTTQRDVKTTGLGGNSDPSNYVCHNVNYTGIADSDVMMGGNKSDVLIAGQGESELSGGTGSDTYYIGGNSQVSIHDVDSRDSGVYLDCLDSLLSTIVKGDMLAGFDLGESLSALLSTTNRDVIVFTDCSFDDMSIDLEQNFLATDYYIITAGKSTVRVPRRTSAKQDFYVIDASGTTNLDGMALGDLYASKHAATNSVSRASLASISPDESEPAELVSFTAQGQSIRADIIDLASGETIATLSSDETADYCFDAGTFATLSGSSTVEGAYDPTLIRIQFTAGHCDRIITNVDTDDIEGEAQYADDIDFSQFQGVAIEADETVSLIANGVDGETVEIDMTGVGDEGQEPSEPGTETPKTPDDALLKSLLTDAATVSCSDVGDTHQPITYPLMDGYSLGEIELNDSGTYELTVSIDADPYVSRYSEQLNVKHTLVDSAANGGTITLAYDGNGWVVANESAPISFEVTCGGGSSDIPEHEDGSDENNENNGGQNTGDGISDGPEQHNETDSGLIPATGDGFIPFVGISLLGLIVLASGLLINRRLS